jgi:hypothetical protein
MLLETCHQLGASMYDSQIGRTTVCVCNSNVASCKAQQATTIIIITCTDDLEEKRQDGPHALPRGPCPFHAPLSEPGSLDQLPDLERHAGGQAKGKKLPHLRYSAALRYVGTLCWSGRS